MLNRSSNVNREPSEVVSNLFMAAAIGLIGLSMIVFIPQAQDKEVDQKTESTIHQEHHLVTNP